MERICRVLRKLKNMFFYLQSPSKKKRFSELAYWRFKNKVEGTLNNKHYKYFYTDHFGFNEEFFNGKFILDIGCGPRGSLEWATMASRRVGLDPLASEYLRMGRGVQQMEYLDAQAESIPVVSGSCDVVCSFNSLDHVDDIHRTLGEIKRITRSGGCFLVLMEVNHPPTDCEPHNLSPGYIIKMLEPEFVCIVARVFRPNGEGIYKSIRAGGELSFQEWPTSQGYLSAKFIRT